jgi:predicted amidophosphoribosyltransferase
MMGEKHCSNCSRKFDSIDGNGYCPECASAFRRSGFPDYISAAGWRNTITNEESTDPTAIHGPKEREA